MKWMNVFQAFFKYGNMFPERVVLIMNVRKTKYNASQQVTLDGYLSKSETPLMPRELLHNLSYTTWSFKLEERHTYWRLQYKCTLNKCNLSCNMNQY